MCRPLFACVVLAVLPLSSWAEPADTSKETLIRLTVQPMPAPKPALRYLLLPELKEMTPGNPIPNYLKCLIEGNNPAGDRETLSAADLRQADRAARMDKPDWQILLRVKTDGINLLLPDVQKMRELARGLQIRFREEIAQRRFDDALVSAKTMFALSRHMGEHPTLIGDLVGIALASITLGTVQEMLEQPGCPNLYWALTNLPHPFIPLDKGMEGERLLVVAELSDLDDKAPMSVEQLKKVIAHVDKILALESGKPSKKTREWLDARVTDEKLVSAARRRLVDVGLPEERTKNFPADQVILLDEKREYEDRRDEIMKLMNLPFWEAEAMAAKVKPAKEPALLNIFTPALMKVRMAQGRLDQRIALLRHVEALRMYAAEHEGKLPEKLADVSVPLPVDPFSGKPFRYQRDGTTAHLRGTPPRGLEEEATYNLHYEVTIQK